MEKSKYLKPREYELLAILLPDQGEEETKAAIDALQGYITDQNGTIDSINTDSPWGRRRLAYTVRHQGVDYRDGHYVLAYFTAMPAAITEIERELKLDTNVIRYLLLIHDPEMGEKFDESQLPEGETEGAEAEAAPTAAEPAESADEAPAEDAAEADTSEEALSEVAAEAEASEEEPAEEVPAEESAEEVAPAEEAPAEETAEEAEAESSEKSDNA